MQALQIQWDFHCCTWSWSRHLWSRTKHFYLSYPYLSSYFRITVDIMHMHMTSRHRSYIISTSFGRAIIIMKSAPPLGSQPTRKNSCQKCASRRSQARARQRLWPQHGGAMTSMHILGLLFVSFLRLFVRFLFCFVLFSVVCLVPYSGDGFRYKCNSAGRRLVGEEAGSPMG